MTKTPTTTKAIAPRCFRQTLLASLLLTSLLASTSAHADGPTAPPPPTSLAWQLRPTAAGNVVRSDTAVAAYEAGDDSGTTVVSSLLASYKVTPSLAPLLRVAIARNAPPMGDGATSVSNPVVGVTWGQPLAPTIKLAVFGGIAVPIGTGGGNEPDAAVAATNKAAMAARSAMDNALFAVNYTSPIAGVDVAYVANGLTVQAELTMIEAIRVRGDMKSPDSAITNMTSGLHVGYFPLPYLSVGADLRYQRYLTTPAVVKATPAARDNVSIAAGVRGHIKLGGKRWLRPGIAYARGLDDPMSGASYHVVQVDVPFAF
jgi:hypothetical protein